MPILTASSQLENTNQAIGISALRTLVEGLARYFFRIPRCLRERALNSLMLRVKDTHPRIWKSYWAYCSQTRPARGNLGSCGFSSRQCRPECKELGRPVFFTGKEIFQRDILYATKVLGRYTSLLMTTLDFLVSELKDAGQHARMRILGILSKQAGLPESIQMSLVSELKDANLDTGKRIISILSKQKALSEDILTALKPRSENADPDAIKWIDNVIDKQLALSESTERFLVAMSERAGPGVRKRIVEIFENPASRSLP
ncbi:hypothetical protein D8B26_007038 [Coccidioides posadasii str. Silveira]|uniref:uncharacterized protein n=1 Tax=Coccidioides posadasii (strain RMSCC 757 / Silveira) TaxID=443226 RepID=UPI001BEE0EE9|nr:hypothetical protein D8B26_007038 [Coccidioides posadasii str. Silveira]